MKLAEALIERKALKTQMEELRSRAVSGATAQEGDVPAAEDAPQAFMQQLAEVTRQYARLTYLIHLTNTRTRWGEVSLAEAIVQRDMCRYLQKTWAEVESNASPQHRFSRNEVKFVPMIAKAECRQQADGLAKQWRELDVALQAVNWQTELIEE